MHYGLDWYFLYQLGQEVLLYDNQVASALVAMATNFQTANPQINHTSSSCALFTHSQRQGVSQVSLVAHFLLEPDCQRKDS